jgi:long-chain acyl-CoA synthetase
MQSLAAMLTERCRADPQKTAYLVRQAAKWHPIPWSEVDGRVNRLAAGLLSLGLEAGQAVSILGNTRLEWALCDLAILRAGGRSVGIYQTLSGEQIAYILKDSGSRILFAEDADQVAKLDPFLPELPDLKWIVLWDESGAGADALTLSGLTVKGEAALQQDAELVRRSEASIRHSDVAIIIYTSGTTGPPKGALLTHANILAALEKVASLYRRGSEHHMVFFLPLSHVGERIVGHYARIYEGIPAAFVEDLNRILDDVREIRPTIFGSVPRIFEKAYARIRAEVDAASPVRRKLFQWAEGVGREVSRHKQRGATPRLPLRLSYAVADRLVLKRIRELFGGRVQFFISAAAPIAVEILEFFHACGMLILEGYGQTEVSCFCTLSMPDEYRFGAVGKALPNVDVKTADDGEIMVRGEIVFLGYHNQPELTSKTLTEDGWLYTGDLGRLDEDGFLWITGRKKEIIVTSGGKNITPSNIENLLKNHTLIEQAMVHGDKRNYLTALLGLAPDHLQAWGEARGLGSSSYEELTQLPAVRDEVQRIVDEVNGHLARFETIKKFAILPRLLEIETGELTPTLKIRREIVEREHGDLLDSLY